MEHAPVRSTLHRSATALSQISFRRLRDPDYRRGPGKSVRSSEEPQTAVTDPKSSQGLLLPVARADTAPEALSDGYMSDNKTEPIVDPVEVQRTNLEREEELKETIRQLNKLSGDADVIVDETLYSILEKVETVSSTVGQLEQLLRDINGAALEHTNHADDVIQDAKTQLESLASLEHQQKMITDLGSQVSRSREVVQQHKRRLAAVRTKLEDWEKKEIAWQHRTSRRLRILWGAFSLIVGLLFLLSWTKSKTQPEVQTSTNVTVPVANISTSAEHQIPPPTSKALLEDDRPPNIPTIYSSLCSVPDPDRTLRMFDEL